MKIQLIRNATLRLTYAGQTILIDPFLAPQHSMPSYRGIAANPTAPLPLPPDEILADVDLTLISHLHGDHFDRVAQAALPSAMPIVCQPADADRIRDMGFTDVTPLQTGLNWRAITLRRINGQHGTGPTLDLMGPTAGFMLTAHGEPNLYWAGDTVWCKSVAVALEQYRPDVVVVHASGAVWGDDVYIVMDEVQAVAVCRAVPSATVVATHMEALDHGTVSRTQLRRYATMNGVPEDRLLIPADGELLGGPW